MSISNICLFKLWKLLWLVVIDVCVRYVIVINFSGFLLLFIMGLINGVFNLLMFGVEFGNKLKVWWFC